MELRNITRVTGTTPPIQRSSMTPRRWFGVGAALRSWATRHGGGERVRAREVPPDAAPWIAAASSRRSALLAIVALATTTAVWLMASGEPEANRDALWVVHLTLFGLLFAWVTAGFATALMGGWAVIRGDRHALVPHAGPIDAAARTAIVMPICNEDIATVFGGLRSTCTSLAATGASQLFDVFVLSIN